MRSYPCRWLLQRFPKALAKGLALASAILFLGSVADRLASAGAPPAEVVLGTEETLLQKAIADRNLNEAIREVRKLPLAERMQWIEPLSELRTKRLPLSTSSSQNAETTDKPSNSTSAAVDGGASQGGQGGGVIADFQSLINLIHGVVEGNWDVDGGTDTNQQYASGVWIDAQGIVQPKKSKATNRIAASKKEVAEPIALPGVAAWQVGSPLRWISLTRLQERLAQRISKGEHASSSMELLGGLARIDYLAWQPSTKEWLIGGPAGEFAIDSAGDLVHQELRLPPVLLEDLLGIAPHVLGNKGVFGCSIDPQESRLANVQQFLSDKNSLTMLSRTPDKWTQQLTEKLGPQNVTIMGLPKDSPTGLALLVADQHMKRIGLGLESAPKGFNDYIRIADQVNSIPTQGLVRWWFAIRPQTIDTDEEGFVFAMPKNSVQVMSEKEWMDASGKRNATATRDEAADAFAEAFTNRFDEIQKQYPMYGRLRHIFDLTVALEIIRREQKAGRTGGLDGLVRDDLQPHLLSKPNQVPSIATHRKGSNRQIIAIVSGGVVVQPSGISTQLRTNQPLPQTKRLSEEYPTQVDANWILKSDSNR